MRIIIVGAGAIGGLLGACLAQSGQDMLLVARGAQFETISRRGLQLDVGEHSSTVTVPVTSGVEHIDFMPEDVVLLATKSQDTAGALGQLSAVAPLTTPVVCVQNGVDNERSALRTFENVYGMYVRSPASYLEPGVVGAGVSPIMGIFDIGRYPNGDDTLTRLIADKLCDASFSSVAVDQIMRWKYAKLCSNVGNAVEALFGDFARESRTSELAREEAESCFRAAGIDVVGPEEEQDRLRGVLQPVEGGDARSGGSTWQSLERRTGSIEVDYLNGEVVLLGRLHGFPTPVNALLQQYAQKASRDRMMPGTADAAAFQRELADHQ